jgi:LPXTG-motif cell wall-anchored protein
MGLAGGEPALTAVPSVDASYPVATTLPVTGGETTNLWLMVILGAGLALLAGGLVLRARKDEVGAK